ncbi:MAG: ABC transporter substrate-binding protein [Tepidimonas sp.]|uniref:ABC transporter substrate-binding protein n=1 Tax=Tepidimonas sp. TaxID=2002775 RepID=UPI004054D522
MIHRDPAAAQAKAAPFGRRTWLGRAARYMVASAWTANLGVLAGCGGSSPLRIAYHPWPGYAPLELARHMRWWSAETPIEAERTTSATQSVEQLRAGAAHAAALTLDVAIRVHAAGLPLAVVALFDQSLGADVVMGKPRPAGELWRRGLRLGYEASMVGELMAHVWLRRVGLRYADITPIHVAIDAHEAAWKDGLVDVLVTHEPVASRLRSRGLAVLFDSRELPPELPILDVLVVRADALHDHRRALGALLRTVFEGQRHLRELPEDSAYRLAPWLGVAGDELHARFQGLRLTDWHTQRWWLAGEPPRLQKAMHSLAAFMASLEGHEGLIAANVSLPEPRTDFLPLEAP